MRATQHFEFRAQGVGDTAKMILYGGIYQVVAVGFANAGTATIYQLGPDGVTWLTVHAAFTANGGATLYLPPGHYRWTVVGEANMALGVTLVPAT